MQDFDEAFIFAKVVIDQDWAVRQFPHSCSLTDCAPHARKPRQEFHVVEQGIAEAFSGICVIFGNVADDSSEIVQRSLREEDVEIHLGRSSRIFSMETVRPDLESRSPSSIALRVASFSSSWTGAGRSKSDSLVLAMALC